MIPSTMLPGASFAPFHKQTGIIVIDTRLSSKTSRARSASKRSLNGSHSGWITSTVGRTVFAFGEVELVSDSPNWTSLSVIFTLVATFFGWKQCAAVKTLYDEARVPSQNFFRDWVWINLAIHFNIGSSPSMFPYGQYPGHSPAIANLEKVQT